MLNLFQHPIGKTNSNLPHMSIQPNPSITTHRSYDFLKRLLDIVVAIILAIIFLPVWLVVPFAIWIDSGRPIIFKHKRLGKAGEEFELIKFRSMIHNADDLLHKKDMQLLAEFKNGDWKMKNDPRVTRVGRIIRSLTIDEFPQLINVLKGEMSMIGPRAYLKNELAEQTKRYPSSRQYVPAILSVKPGITGLWQVSGRNEIPFPKRAEMDAGYAQRHSILEDITILLKTPRAMISKW